MKLFDTHVKNWQKFLLLFAIFVFCFLVASLIGAIVYMFCKDLVLLQNIVSIITFGGSAFLYYIFFEKKEFLASTFLSNVSFKWFVVALLLWIAGIPFLNTISFNTSYDNTILSMIKNNTSLSGLIYLIFSIALLPAILEEWFFRGVVQRLLISWTKHIWIGIIITSVLFSLIHFDIQNFFARMFLSIILGLLYQYSGNIWTNIFYHFVNNCIATIGLWLFVKTGNFNLERYSFSIISIIISFLIIVAFIIYNERNNNKRMKNSCMEQDKIDFEK